MNGYLINNKNIVIDPISGKAMLGKNLDRNLSSNSLRDRRSSGYEQDRVRQFIKQRKSVNP